MTNNEEQLAVFDIEIEGWKKALERAS